MKKKIFALFITMLFTISIVSAATIQTAIAKYKSGNYTGCISDMNAVARTMLKDATTNDATKKIASVLSKHDLEKISKLEKEKKYSDTNLTAFYKDYKKVINTNKASKEKLAYIFYYDALSFHQIGMNDMAKTYYVFAYFFSPQTQIGQNSQMAKKCLDNPGTCAASDMDEFIKSGKTVSDDIIRQELQKNIRTHQENINKEAGAPIPPKNNNGPQRPIPGAPSNKNTAPAGEELSPPDLSSTLNDNEKIAWADDGVITNVEGRVDYNAQTTSETPTDEEIGRAVRTLQKAGINPMTYMNPTPMDAEYAQMNALLNDGYYSYGYNPMMMMNNGSQKMSPEVMQVLMQQQMLGSYGM